MKKKLLILLLVACGAFATAALASCTKTPAGNSSSSPQEPVVEQPNDFLWTVAMPNGVEYQNVVNVPSISVYEECRIQTVELGATYSSSDSTVASVSNLGVVRGLKAGNVVITITAGENVQTVNFIVNEAGNVPVIVLENSNVPQNEQGQYACSLFVGGAMNIGAKLKYNGLAYTSDVTFSYESENNEIATITNGMIRAIGEGTVTLRVKANDWRGYAGSNLIQTITVVVKPNVSLSVAEEEVELYTKQITDEPTSFDFAPTVIVDEVENTDAEFTFDYDEKIVSVSASGEVTAVGEGETDVVIGYTTAGGYAIEKTVRVRVILPIVNSNVALTVDKSGMTLDKAKFNLLDTENYVRIADEKTGASDAFEGNVFTGQTLPTGERTLVIYSNKQGYRIQALVVDKIIKTEAELRALQTTEDVTAYYVLGGNISLTSTFDGITSGTFSGIFDGNGYAISGGKVSYGLLGKNTLNATVRNLAIVDVGLATYPGSANCNGALLAHRMDGTTTIENVYLKMNNPDAWALSAGVWAYCARGTFNAKNVVSYVDSDRTNMASFICWADGVTLNLSNVYCASQVQMNLINTSAPTTINLTQYTSLAAMKAAYGNKQIDISWASGFNYYSSLQAFLTA